jgi:hypothetical protein
VRKIRDLIDERVRRLATEKIHAIRLDATSHRWRLAKLLPQRRGRDRRASPGGPHTDPDLRERRVAEPDRRRPNPQPVC